MDIDIGTYKHRTNRSEKNQNKTGTKERKRKRKYIHLDIDVKGVVGTKRKKQKTLTQKTTKPTTNNTFAPFDKIDKQIEGMAQFIQENEEYRNLKKQINEEKQKWKKKEIQLTTELKEEMETDNIDNLGEQIREMEKKLDEEWGKLTESKQKDITKIEESYEGDYKKIIKVGDATKAQMVWFFKKQAMVKLKASALKLSEEYNEYEDRMKYMEKQLKLQKQRGTEQRERNKVCKKCKELAITIDRRSYYNELNGKRE